MNVNVDGVSPIAGTTSFTVKSTVAEPLPPAFEAVTVYVAVAITEVGVPETSQFEASSDRPAGNDGATEQVEIAPPLLLGLNAVIADPFVNVWELGEYPSTGQIGRAHV